MSEVAAPVDVDIRRRNRGRLVLGIFLVICAAPIVASYLAYYVVKPSSRTNYGTLIEPQRPVPSLAATTLDGQPFDLSSLAGKWLMVTVDRARCDVPCATKLFEMRQLRLVVGKDQDRIERVWFITDEALVPAAVLAAYPGTVMLRANETTLSQWLPADDSIANHLFLVDPHQHLMMRFPNDADPYRIKRDLTKLLGASEIG
jgi:hypothetical protein